MRELLFWQECKDSWLEIKRLKIKLNESGENTRLMSFRAIDKNIALCDKRIKSLLK